MAMFRLAAYSWSLRRQAIAVLAMVGLLVATVGIPVLRPVRGPGAKDLSQPFPCMHSLCGCHSAAACWQGCCCHTNREKLAWADANGVVPPEYVVAAASLESPAGGSCCSSHASGEHGAEVEDSADSASPVAGSGLQVTLVSAIAARKCQGLPQLFLILSSALPACVAPAWRPEQPACEWLVTWSAAAPSIGDLPATPPPRQ
jgi:hypothetical protein